MGIGPRIKEARLRKGLTQKDLAIKMGVTPSAIANYETGVSSPKEPVLRSLLSALEVEPNYLFSEYFEGKKTAAQPDDGLSPREREVALAYRAASEDDKAVVDAVLKKYIVNEEENSPELAM